jgi:hypothetical protein
MSKNYYTNDKQNKFMHPNDSQVIVKYDPPDTYLKEHLLIIDSRDRNRQKYPNPNNYVVRFNSGGKGYGTNFNGTEHYTGDVQENFKNIVSIQLLDCSLPHDTAILEPYITLSIPELYPTYAGTNQHLSNIFTILTTDAKVNTTVPTYTRCRFNFAAINRYELPMSSLNQLTFQFKTGNGDFFPFMTNTSEQLDLALPAEPKIQNQMVFRIVTKEINNKMLNHVFTYPDTPSTRSNVHSTNNINTIPYQVQNFDI